VDEFDIWAIKVDGSNCTMIDTRSRIKKLIDIDNPKKRKMEFVTGWHPT
jgi:hypothetical protein